VGALVAGAEVEDNFLVTTLGSGNGYDLNVPATATILGPNGLPASIPNLTSRLTFNAPANFAAVNSLTVDAPRITVSQLGANSNGLLVRNAANFTAPESTIALGNQGANANFGTLVLAGKVTGNNMVVTLSGTPGNGGGQLILTNTDTGAGANAVTSWTVFGGSNATAVSNAAPNQSFLEARAIQGGSSPLNGAPVTINGGRLNLRADGDNTTLSQVIDTFATSKLIVGSTTGVGSNSYIGSAPSILDANRFSTASNKTIRMGELVFGGPLGSTFLNVTPVANGYSVAFDKLTMARDAYFVIDAPVTIYGAIGGSGTVYKQNAGSLFINGDNSAFKGGLVVNGGAAFLGTFEGVVTTLSDTAKFTGGNILVNPAQAVQFNSVNNVPAGWTGIVDVRSNIDNMGLFRLAADAPLSSFNLRVGSLGGPQDTSHIFYSNVPGRLGAGSLSLDLGTAYSQVLDMATIGDGTAYLGSATNQVGQLGSYNAATLGAGAGNTYRLGAGGNTLYIAGDSVNSNILTGANKLVVGTPDNPLNGTVVGGGNGNVFTMTPQNYTGATTVYRASTLDFRGALASPSFDTYGLLIAGGTGGTFSGKAPVAGFNSGAVNIHPGAELRFDNSTGLLPASATQGRWDDAQAITLDNATLRVIGSRVTDINETVGDVTLKGGAFVAAQRDQVGRITSLTLGGGAGQDLVRTVDQSVNGFAITGNNATLQVNPAAGGQLGSEERVLLQGGVSSLPGGITNGMVQPWMVNATDSQFLTYTNENGFVNAGFSRINVGGTLAVGAGISLPNERYLLQTANLVITGGIGNGLDVHALRMDTDITLTGTPAATDRIVLRSGGLIANGARAINSGIQFGNGSPTEANIFNNNNLVIGLFANDASTGKLTGASNIVKQGAGNLFVDVSQPSFNGNWIIDQVNSGGGIFFRTQANAVFNLGGAATAAQRSAGTGGWVALNAFNSVLGLRSDVTGPVTGATFTVPGAGNNVTVSSATGLVIGQPFAGAGIAPGTTITAIAGTTVTLSGNAFAGAIAQASNFIANAAGTVNLTGVNSTTGTAVVTVDSTAGLFPGMTIAGAGLNGTVAQITGPNTFTLSANAGVTLSGQTAAGLVGTTVFNFGLQVGEGTHLAQIQLANAGFGGTAPNAQTYVLNGQIRLGGSPGEQGQTLIFNSANSIVLADQAGLDLGPAGANGEQTYAAINNNNGGSLTIYGPVTGGANFVKAGGSQTDFFNVNTGVMNTFPSITTIQGTLNVRGTGSGITIPNSVTVTGNSTITTTSTAGLVAGMQVNGAGIPAGATIASITDATHFVLSANATASATISASTGTFKTLVTNTSANQVTNPIGSDVNQLTDGTQHSGGIGSGALILYGGNTQLRIDVGTNDGTRQRFWAGSGAAGFAGNSLVVNGSSQMTIDRQSGAYANKHLAFKDLTIGSENLNVTSGNYVFEINGGTTLLGTPTFQIGSGQILLNGAVQGMGLGVIKNSAGDLWINGVGQSSFGGLYAGQNGPTDNGLGIVVNGGLIRFGDVSNEGLVINVPGMLNNSRIRINPNGNMFLASTNVTIGAGQVEQFSVGPQYSLLRLGTGAITGATAASWTTPNSLGVVALNTTNANPFDLALFGNQNYYLGATGAATYQAGTLGVGAGNTYRLGGGGSALTFQTLNGTPNGAGVLGGANKVLIGGNGANLGGTVLFNDVNTYTGPTIVSRGNDTLQFIQQVSATAGPLGLDAAPQAVDNFGTLTAQGSFGSFQNLAKTGNQYNVILHPGSTLRLDSNTALGFLSVTGGETTGSPTIANIRTSGLVPGMTITGTGIPAGTVITAVGANSITLNNNATATSTTNALAFTIVGANTSGSPVISFGTQPVPSNLAVGQSLTGTGIPVNTFIAAIDNTANTITLSNNTTAAATAALTIASNDRWNDNTALGLNGANLILANLNNASLTETVGPVAFDKGARFTTVRTGTGQVVLSTASLTRNDHGTMVFVPTTAANFGGLLTNTSAERFLVTVPANEPPTFAGAAPAYFVDGTSNQFVTYVSNQGFADVTDSVNASTANFPTTTVATDRVNVGTTASTLAGNAVMQTLRTNQNISNPASAYTTLTLSAGGTGGGLLAYGNTTITPHVKFGANGTEEGLIYTASGITATLTGDLTASAITKFGAGTLAINKDQSDAARGQGNGYSNGWFINEGAVTINTFGGFGNAVASNTVTLNGSSQTSAAGTTLNLSAPTGTGANSTYSMGRLIAVDNAIVTVNNGINDSTSSIGEVEINNTDTTGTTQSRLRVNLSNARQMLNTGTLFLSGSGASIFDVNGTATGSGSITSGVTTGVGIAGLSGSQDLYKWGNGELYVRGDNRTSFTGSVFVEQGALGVTNANAFAANTNITVRRYGTFDILAPGIAKVPTYEAGSIERWSVENARAGAVNLGAATLQVNNDQFDTNATVTLNGGAIEGFLRTEDYLSNNSGTVFRTLGSGVKINLASSSFIGQNALTDGPNGLDNGRATDINPSTTNPDVNNNSAFTDTARGVVLEIKGQISGPGGLTKQGGDVVTLSGANTFAGRLLVQEGVLRVGNDQAIPLNGSVKTAGSGILDLSGHNVTIGQLSSNVPGNVPTTPTFLGGQGYITNSATTQVTLTVGGGTLASDSFQFDGIIQNNVALTKIGDGMLTIGNQQTYLGATTIAGGTLALEPTYGGLPAASTIRFAGNGTLAMSSTVGNRVAQFGALDLVSGDATIAPSDIITGPTMNFSSVTRHAGATVNYNPQNAIISFTGRPSGFMDQGSFFQGMNYAFYDATPGVGVRALDYTADPETAVVAAGTTFGLGAGGRHVDLQGDVTAQTTTAIQTLRLNGPNSVTLASGADLTLGTINGYNGLLKIGGGTSTIGGGNSLKLTGSTDLVVRTDTASDTLIVATRILDNASNALTKSGPGTLVLSGANTYAGVTFVNDGILQIGNAGTTGSIVSPSVALGSVNAQLAFNRTDTATFGSLITGSGSLQQLGTGKTILTADSTYTGGTTITAGTLQLGNGGTTGSIIGNVLDNGTLDINHSNNTTFTGTISGSGGVQKDGAGVLTLASAARRRLCHQQRQPEWRRSAQHRHRPRHPRHPHGDHRRERRHDRYRRAKLHRRRPGHRQCGGHAGQARRRPPRAHLRHRHLRRRRCPDGHAGAPRRHQRQRQCRRRRHARCLLGRQWPHHRHRQVAHWRHPRHRGHRQRQRHRRQRRHRLARQRRQRPR
jgi:autotransporter-associated beta strand protein